MWSAIVDVPDHLGLSLQSNVDTTEGALLAAMQRYGMAAALIVPQPRPGLEVVEKHDRTTPARRGPSGAHFRHRQRQSAGRRGGLSARAAAAGDDVVEFLLRQDRPAGCAAGFVRR